VDQPPRESLSLMRENGTTAGAVTKLSTVTITLEITDPDPPGESVGVAIETEIEKDIDRPATRVVVEAGVVVGRDHHIMGARQVEM
jgi:hypothetical protein